jgi:ATP-dependent DNA ligase
MNIAKGALKVQFPELRGNLRSLRFPCFGEIKLDGEATAIFYQNGSCWTSNKYGTTRTEWSKLDEIAELCEAKGIEKATFIAELYLGDGKAGALYGLLSNKDNDKLNISVFDVQRLDNSQDIIAPMNLIERREALAEVFSGSGLLLPTKVISSKEDAEQFFHDATEIDGYEGIVLKNFDGRFIAGPCDWVKLKKKDQTEYKVDNIDLTKERMDVLVPIVGNIKPGTQVLCTPRGNFIKVGVKLTNKDKKGLSVGDTVVIEHQGVLDSGSLRHPVFVKKGEKCDATE